MAARNIYALHAPDGSYLGDYNADEIAELTGCDKRTVGQAALTGWELSNGFKVEKVDTVLTKTGCKALLADFDATRKIILKHLENKHYGEQRGI